MKVKIKDKFYNSEKEPILLTLSPQDRLNILGMAPHDSYFCCYPDGMAEDRIEYFIQVNNEGEEAPHPYKELVKEELYELAKKLVSVYQENVNTLAITRVGCCGNDHPVICNQNVLLRCLLEDTFGLTSDEACDLIHYEKSLG